MGVMTPVAPTMRTGRSAKQATPMSQGSEPEHSCQGSHEGDSEVMDSFLDISSQLCATEIYRASQQETERVHRMGGITQLTGAECSRRGSTLPATECSRRGSTLPATSTTAAASISEAVRARVVKCLRKARILEMTTTEEQSRSDKEARDPCKKERA